MIRSCIILGLGMVIGLSSCNNDDDAPLGDVDPPRPLSEVAAENDAEIQAYFSTHFYNYEEFENPPEDFDYRIVIDTIAGENQDKRPISESGDLLSSVDINVSSTAFLGLDEENDVPHRLYYLSVREGQGENPSIADSVYVDYEGFLLNNEVFDANLTWFDLQGTGTASNAGSFVRGFEEGLTLFKDGTELILNDDGTFEVNDSGIGVLFMPSGLGYFNSSSQVGESFAPLAFKINLVETNIADHDGDGIPSLREDLDNDLDLFNDDTDGDGIPNYLDVDDDNDERLTEDEIVVNDDGTITFEDSDNDNIPDHLDPDN
ncbi:FKBP-type peptidyl-prolyl cis-trans isomerase [Maribacter sp. 2-571]|uniref:FKBP-type peptidyl-prolyl cis-trans isomerase n=1 Tax=Maribacter sp. 2-571 TaxID=3417569 RepID=UPI003D33AF3C